MSNATIQHIANVFPVNADALKPDPKSPKPREIIRDFSLNTSTHGIPGIARSESLQNCIFWTVSFLSFVGITCYFIVQAIFAYFEYPTLTSINFLAEWPQTFPAVTICNYSPYRFDKLIEPYLNFTNEYNLTNRTTFSPEQALIISRFVQEKLNRNESLNDFFYPLSSMLIKCTFNGVTCSKYDFVQFTSPLYGLCYTFNAQSQKINNGTLRYNNENGYSGVLELDLYIHSHQYVPYVADGIGIVTMIHDNTQLPLIDRAGIQLIPGRKHKFGYTKRANRFLLKPYTTCSYQLTPGMAAMFSQFEGTNYTYGEEMCFKVAIQTYIYATCGCINPYEWSARYIVLPGTTEIIYSSLCNISDPCYSTAANTFRSSDTLIAEYAANCDLDCSSNEFVLQPSAVIAPPQWRMKDIKQFVEASSIPLAEHWPEQWSSEIHSNYVGLSVVCAATRVETYSQQATITAVDVISNVGGQTGLWIGISFLSLMEFAEMVFRLVRHRIYHLREKFRRRTLHQSFS